MAIGVQHHTNVSKQTTLFDGIDVGPPKWRISVHKDMNDISKETTHSAKLM